MLYAIPPGAQVCKWTYRSTYNCETASWGPAVADPKEFNPCNSCAGDVIDWAIDSAVFPCTAYKVVCNPACDPVCCPNPPGIAAPGIDAPAECCETKKCQYFWYADYDCALESWSVYVGTYDCVTGCIPTDWVSAPLGGSRCQMVRLECGAADCLTQPDCAVTPAAPDAPTVVPEGCAECCPVPVDWPPPAPPPGGGRTYAVYDGTFGVDGTAVIPVPTLWDISCGDNALFGYHLINLSSECYYDGITCENGMAYAAGETYRPDSVACGGFVACDPEFSSLTTTTEVGLGQCLSLIDPNVGSFNVCAPYGAARPEGVFDFEVCGKPGCKFQVVFWREDGAGTCGTNYACPQVGGTVSTASADCAGGTIRLGWVERSCCYEVEFTDVVATCTSAACCGLEITPTNFYIADDCFIYMDYTATGGIIGDSYDVTVTFKVTGSAANTACCPCADVDVSRTFTLEGCDPECVAAPEGFCADADAFKNYACGDDPFICPTTEEEALFIAYLCGDDPFKCPTTDEEALFAAYTCG